MRVLFYGAGSANLGGAQLMRSEIKMEPTQVIVTNSKGGERGMRRDLLLLFHDVYF